VSVSLSIDGPGDAELISAVRGGDIDAYGDLFARHVDSARRLARQLAGPADADDLVSDAFTKVLTVLQRGGGPDLAFRAYLLTAVRRLHVDKIRAGSRLRPVDDLTPFDPGLPFHDTAVEGFENAAAARAFASLPERWQMVLWHTEVEQQKPADIAPLLGMSANSVSALAYRAREGLRQAFLSQHATDPDDVDCAWARDHMGAYVRGGLSRRDATKVDDHLAACRACAAVYLELTEVNSGLAGLLAPLLLGSAGAGYLSSGGLSSGGAVSGGFTAAKTWAASHASLTAVGGMLVTATAVFSIYGVTHFNGHSTADLGSPPALNRPPAASTLPPTGNDSRGPGSSDRGHSLAPGQTSTDPSVPGPSTAPAAPTSPTSAPVTNDSTAPVVTPSDPTSSPTTGPTDPTTGPTDPGGNDQITFTSTPPTNPTFGSTYDVAASSDSGKHVTFSVDPTSNSLGEACTISGSTVTFEHAGTCVVAAETPANKAAGQRVTQSIDVLQAAQKVTITSTAPTAPTFGQPYPVTATSDSGAPVTLSVEPTSNSLGKACSLSGSTVTFDHAGSCAITAQAGNDDYLPASDLQTVDVARAAQDVQLSPAAPSTATAGGSYDFTASGGASGNPVVVTTGNADVCVVVGSTVSLLNPGACEIHADQAENQDYEPGSFATTINVVAPADADLAVTARPWWEIGGFTGATATVTGLPQGSTATMTVVPDGNYALKPVNDGGTCSKSGPANYSCQVTPTRTQFWFAVNVNGTGGGQRFVTFEVQPDAPLTDTNPRNNTFRLQLGD